MARTRFYVGTAGWSYLQWDREFYPIGIKAADKLAFYASRFNAIELNNSFYRTPTAEQFHHWQSLVPGRFRFAVKAPRYITHTKKLSEPKAVLPPFLKAVDGLHQSGPIFFQAPPTLPIDLVRLENFLDALPNNHRYSIELRHPSWHVKAVYALLARRRTAFCLFDTPEEISPRQLTTDFAYVRLRGRSGRTLNPFLQEWQQWLSEHSAKAYVFFDNREQKDLAFGNALAFREMARAG